MGESPFFAYLRKYHCPFCRQPLIRKDVVHSDSCEVQKCDLDLADPIVEESAKIVHAEFLCESCGRCYKLRDNKK